MLSHCGSKIIIVDRLFPSSKTCSCCGHIQDMPLKERVFNCGNCGVSIDRDLNNHDSYDPAVQEQVTAALI